MAVSAMSLQILKNSLPLQWVYHAFCRYPSSPVVKLSEVTNVTSVLPGTLVQSLVTAVSPHGLNLQVLGFFDGTAEQLHLTRPPSEYKVGKKVKGRVLYDFSSSPPRFALALADHVMALGSRRAKAQKGSSEDQTLQDICPVGKVVEQAIVLRIEAERGIFVEVERGLEGFVHVR
jgi:rRNA biogenesis protein RRP5